MFTDKNIDCLLLDGKNNIYRSLFAGCADPRFKASGHDYIIIFLRFLSTYINKFRPKSVHIFWDAPASKLWRRQIYPEYKEHRSDMYEYRDIDVYAELKHQMIAAIQLCKNLNIRQYFSDNQEADDLIYAFVYTNTNKDTLIVSSDGDFKQILFKFSHCKIYNPLKKGDNMEERPQNDPTLLKSFIGDKSDNISGYYQIGKVRAAPLVESVIARQKFFLSDKAVIMKDGQKVIVGADIFNRNRQIIDLGLSPYLKDNIAFIEQQQVSSIQFDMKQIELIAHKYKLRGLLSEINNLSVPFQNLE